MPDSIRSLLRDLAVAAGCVTAGALARYLLFPIFAPYVPFLILATFACGHYFGIRAGWFALAMAVFPLSILRAIETKADIDWFPMPSGLVFISTGACLLLLNRAERRAKEAAQRSAAEATEQRNMLEQHMAEHRKMAAALEESEQRLNLVMQVAKIGTYDFNLQTGHIIWSPLMAQMHGYTPEGFDGTLAAAIAHNHPDDQRELLARVELNKQDLASREYTYRVLLPDGGTRWVRGFGQAFTNASGEPVRMLGACIDVTKEKELEFELRTAKDRFRVLAENAPVAILESKPDAQLTFVNHKWCEIAGCQREEALGFGWRNFIHPDDLDWVVEQSWADLAEGKIFTAEFRFCRPDGEIRWAVCFADALRDESGEVVAYITTLLDITDRKRALEELESEKDFLRQSLDLRERERQVFAYEVHDGMIQDITGAKMVLEGAKSQLPPEHATGLEPVVAGLKKAIDEGRRVINGIRTPVLDDEGLIAGIEHLVSERRKQMHIEFVPPEDPPGRLVPELEAALYRITQEALTNAVKHSRSPSAQVMISCDEVWIYLTIQDWGVGFDSTRTRQGNLGLRGIRERVKLLEGHFDLITAPGEGTRLEIMLPLRRRRNAKVNGALSRAE